MSERTVDECIAWAKSGEWNAGPRSVEAMKVLAREVARLRAGGCARDQKTTQFCAEAVALAKERDDAFADLRLAKSKLAKLARLIDLAEQANDTQTDNEVAASASFNEALAITAGQMAEEERDELKTAALALLNTNGGPLDVDNTVDGQEYIMVKLDKFKELARAAGQENRV